MRVSRLLIVMCAAVLFLGLSSFGRGEDSAGSAIDVSLVSPRDFLAVVIHPRRIAQSPLVAQQLKDETIAGAIKKFGVEPSDVAEIVVLVGLGKNRSGGLEPIPVTVIRFTHDVDAKGVLTRLEAAMAPRGAQPIKEVQVRGKTCLDLGVEKDAPLAYVPSKNTIVVTTKENMAKVVSAGVPQGPLLERLKKAEADNDIIVALAPEAFPNLDTILEAAKQGVPQLVATYLDAAKTVRGGTAAFSMTAPVLVHLVLDTNDAEAAGNVEELLQQALRMASGGLVVAKQSIPKQMKNTLDPLVKLADQFIDGAKATKSGSQVVLDVKRPAILDTAGVSILGAVTQSVVQARSAARRAQQMNNLKQVALAMLMYCDSKGAFPPAASEKDGKPLLSWRVAILPYVEETALYQRFHLDEPWDSPHNLEVAKTMPRIFQSPDSPSDSKTRVVLFAGKGTAFDGGKKIRPEEIRDGTSNTILCVEAGPDKAVLWTKPEDLRFESSESEKPLAALGKVSRDGFAAAFFDGHVLQLKVDNETLKALITPDGGEVIDPSKLGAGK
jgi:hypothetical protein